MSGTTGFLAGDPYSIELRIQQIRDQLDEISMRLRPDLMPRARLIAELEKEIRARKKQKAAGGEQPAGEVGIAEPHHA